MLHAVLTSFPPAEDEVDLVSRIGEPTLSSPEKDLSAHHTHGKTSSSWIQPSPPPSQAHLLNEIAISGEPSEGSTTDVTESESESVPLLSESWTATSPPPRADSLGDSLVTAHSESDNDPPPAPASDAADDSDDNASTLADEPISREPARPLADILRAADDLLARFPPSDPRLAVDRILGPQSVLFTWSENRKDMPSDDDAEKMVDAPELVVRADFVDEDELLPPSKERRKPQERPRSWWFAGIGKHGNEPSPATIVAGVVLAVSIGVAVYDISRRAQGKKEL